MVCESAAAVNLRCGWRGGFGQQKTRDEVVFGRGSVKFVTRSSNVEG
jgi:hypothetical protein